MRADQLASAFLLGVSTREPSFREYVSEMLDKLFEKIKSTSDDFFSEEFLVPGLLNFIRDWVWTYSSYLSVDIALHQTEDANFDTQGQWLSQQVYSSLAMLAALALMIAFYKIKKPLNENSDVKSFPFRLAIIYFIAASFAIYAWDRAQVFGADICQNHLNFSAAAAAYTSGIATGIEGAVQNTIITASRFATEVPRDLLKKENAGFFAKAIGKRVISNLVANWPPGTAWQLVFALGSTQNYGAVPTSFLVAFTVLFFNFVCPKFSVFILSRWIKDESEKIRVMLQARQNAVAENLPQNEATVIEVQSTENIPPSGTENLEREKPPERDPSDGDDTSESIIEVPPINAAEDTDDSSSFDDEWKPVVNSQAATTPKTPSRNFKLLAFDELSVDPSGSLEPATSGAFSLANSASLLGAVLKAEESAASLTAQISLKIDPSIPDFSISAAESGSRKLENPKPISQAGKRLQLAVKMTIAKNQSEKPKEPEEKKPDPQIATQPETNKTSPTPT